ncbi:MAG: urease accessory protein UreD [Candidatus Binatia bacterium]
MPTLPRSPHKKSCSPQVALRFACAPGGHTFLAEQFVTYPFFLTTPFTLDRCPASLVTVMLQSVSGGIYERDQLGLSFVAEENAQVHLTTQSATIVHAMAEKRDAQQQVSINAAAGSLVEYLPDPLVLFPGAKLRTSLQVVAAEEATVMIGETFVLHAPDNTSNSTFPSLYSELMVRHPTGRLLCVDRNTFPPRDGMVSSSGVLQHSKAFGTFWLLSSAVPTEFLTTLQEAWNAIPGLYGGSSLLPNHAGVWGRCLAADTIALERAFQAAWMLARRSVTGQMPTRQRKSLWY